MSSEDSTLENIRRISESKKLMNRVLCRVIVSLAIATIATGTVSPRSVDAKPRVATPISIPDLNLQVDLTRAISSSFHFMSMSCLSGRTSFPTIASIARSIETYPERWTRARVLACRPRARLNPYTFTVFGTATSSNASLTDGIVIARCSFGADVRFRLRVELGAQLPELIRMAVTEPFRFPVTCGFRITSALQGFTVTGSVDGVAEVDGLDNKCVEGIRACAPFALTGAAVRVTSATGRYAGTVAIGTFNHADILQMPELVQLSYLVDTARGADVLGADVVSFDVAPAELSDVPPLISMMEIQFVTGNTVSSLLRPVDPLVGRVAVVPSGGDITVATAPGVPCRVELRRGAYQVPLGARTSTSLGLATWLISARVREYIATKLADTDGSFEATIYAVCTTIDTRAVMTRRALFE